MKEKEKEVGDIFDEDDVVPIGIILKKKEIVEAMVQNSTKTRPQTRTQSG